MEKQISRFLLTFILLRL